MRRLLRHYASPHEVMIETPFLMARVLEDGDSSDLTELFATIGEERVGRWLETRGGRQLSRRSRLFWSLVLGVDASPPHPLGSELWPL
jgi:hypothetical protein